MNLGGNRIDRVDPRAQSCVMATEPYAFRLETVPAGQRLPVPPAACGVVHVIAGALVRGEQRLGAGDVLVVNHDGAELTAEGATRCLIATRDTPAGNSSTQINRSGDVKRVTKPWGHELWLTGEHDVLALKLLFIRAGKRLSLQFHERKRETMLLHSGSVRFWYKASPSVDNRGVTDADLAHELLEPLTVCNVLPGCLHRLEATSDAVLYEASTPELDDVIRVSDDWDRKAGRIASEHESM